MANFRTSVTLTDHMKQRIQQYADAHGATISGALVALAARTLDRDEQEAAGKPARRRSEGATR